MTASSTAPPRIGVLILLVAASTSPSASAPAVTPEEVLSWVSAEQQRYQTFQAEIENQCYPYEDGQLRSRPLEVNSVLWRKTPKRSFMQVKRIAGDDAAGIPAGEERWYSISAEYSRKLDISSTGWPVATVAKGESMKDQLLTSPEKAIWEPFGPGMLPQVGNENSQVTQTDAGTFQLTASLNDGTLVMTMVIDPAVGFLPTSTEFRRPDGTLISLTKLADIRQVDGLWLPFTYVQDQPPLSIMEYRVRWARLNEPIPDDMLDFAFPENTRVDDRVANVVYRVTLSGSQSADQSLAALQQSIGPDDLAASQPADDPALAAVADEARRQGAVTTTHVSSRVGSHVRRLYLPIGVALASAAFLLLRSRCRRGQRSPSATE